MSIGTPFRTWFFTAGHQPNPLTDSATQRLIWITSRSFKFIIILRHKSQADRLAPLFLVPNHPLLFPSINAKMKNSILAARPKFDAVTVVRL